MWKEGKEHGMETKWYDNGQKLYKRMWKEGKEHGMDRWWNHDGT